MTYQIDELVGIAYLQCVTAQITVNGFQKTGIHPTKIFSVIKKVAVDQSIGSVSFFYCSQ
jgi:hypothetical protein